MNSDLDDIVVGEINFLASSQKYVFGRYTGSEVWAPAINLYQLPGRLELCVDLSGVDPKELEIQIEPGQLRIKGYRHAPAPVAPDSRANESSKIEQDANQMKIICMEIDYGPFGRNLNIPRNVDIDKVTSRYGDGLLWIDLPLI